MGSIGAMSGNDSQARVPLMLHIGGLQRDLRDTALANRGSVTSAPTREATWQGSYIICSIELVGLEKCYNKLHYVV